MASDTHGVPLRVVRAATISQNTLAGLAASINKLLSGQATTSAGDGTDQNYATGWVGNKTLIDIQYYAPTSTLFTCLILYTN